MSQTVVGLRVDEETFLKHIAVITPEGMLKIDEIEYDMNSIRRVCLDLYGNTVIAQIVFKNKKKLSIKLDSLCCVWEMHKLVDLQLFDDWLDPNGESHGFCKVLGALLSKAPIVQTLSCSSSTSKENIVDNNKMLMKMAHDEIPFDPTFVASALPGLKGNE